MRSTALDPTKAPWNESGVEPACVLEIAWADGTAYYSTRGWTYSGTVVEDRVMRWDKLAYSIPDSESVGRKEGVFSMSLPSVGVTLRDDDRAILLKIRRNKTQGLAAKIYQAAHGQDPTYFLLFEGIVTHPVAWERGRVTLKVSPAHHVARRPVGLIADKTDFSKCWPPDVGRLLPIVFGVVKKVPAVGVQVGRKGSLREDVDGSQTTILIDGFDDYDTSTVRLWVGLESMTGAFNGGKFVNVTLGGAVLASGAIDDILGYTSASAPLTTIVGVDNQYIGYWLRMDISLADYQTGAGVLLRMPIGLQQYFTAPSKLGYSYRPIIGYQVVEDGGLSGDDVGKFYLQYPFMFEDKRELAYPAVINASGYLYEAANARPVDVVSPPGPHEKGEEVWEVPSGGCVYVVAGHSCKAVRGVYARGHKRTSMFQRYGSAGYTFGGGCLNYSQEGAGGVASRPDSRDSYIEIPPSFYRVDLADTSILSGKTVTTVTFDVPVPCLPGYEFSGPEIFVDVEGWADGGTLVENPVDALEDVLGEYADDVPLNAASFTSAASSVDWLKCAFALTGERLTVAQLATAMAVQCRCRAVWIDGELHMEFLHNCIPGALDGRFYHEVVEGSHRLQRRRLSDIVTELEYAVTTSGDRKLFKKEDSRAITRYGRRGVARLDFWMYQKEVYADAVAEFWLHRLKFEAMRARVRTPLTHIRYLPGDWMRLYVTGVLQPYKTMEIVKVEHDLGGVGRTPSLMFEMIEPYGQWARSLSYLDGGGDGNDAGSGSAYGGGDVCPATWECPSSDTCVGCDAYCDGMADVLDCTVIADIQAGEFALGGCAAIMDTVTSFYNWNTGV